MKSSTFLTLYGAALIFLSRGAVFAQGAPTQGQPQPSPAALARFQAWLAQVQDLEKRHTITINGWENPAGLQRGAMLRMLFPRGGPADDAAFAQFALEQYGATGSDTEVLREARYLSDAVRAKPVVDICARVLDGSLPDGVSIAKYVAQIDADDDRDTAVRYQSILDKLSPRVRANVLRKIAEDVGGMSSSNLDHLGMAQEDPDLYKTMMISRCRGKQMAASSRRDPIPTVTREGHFASSSAQH